MTTRTNRNGTGPRHRGGLERVLPATPLQAAEPPPAVPPPADRHLQSLERKLQLVRDYTTRVALGYSPGLFVWGAGGIGKSFTVVRQLDALEANHKLLNSRVTGWGLFCHLEKYPSHVTLIEDAESMFRDPRAVGVLRSALDCQRREGDRGPVERWVTWAGDSTARKTKQVLISGGIIVLSNAELPARPEVEALKTRIPCVHLTATDEELRALMRAVSARGYSLNGQTMTPAQCGEVCAYIEDQVHALRSPLNMRLLVNGYAAFIQWAAGLSGTHWHDMLRGEIREQAPQVFTEGVTIRRPPGRADRKAEHHRVVREILSQTADREERLRLWREHTGLEQSAFYARKAEVEADGR
jgi:hypothetical protein